MNSPTLALLHRCLVEDDLSPHTYLNRVGLLGTIAVAFAFSSPGGAPGLWLFVFLTILNMALLVLSGVTSFASVIAEEKEQDTLGLLRMTRLGPLAILLGKSVSRQLASFQLIVVQIPVMLLAVAFGGIAPVQILQTYVAMLAFLILVSNLGLLCSVMARSSRRAGALMLVILLGLGWFPYIVNQVASVLVANENVDPDSLLPTVATLLMVIPDSISPVPHLWLILSGSGGGSLLHSQVWGSVLIGVLCFLIAWRSFGTFCNAAPRASDRSRGWQRSWSRLGRPGRAPVHFTFVWRDFHHLAGGWKAFGTKVVLYLAIVAIAYVTTQPTRSYGYGNEYFASAVGMLLFACFVCEVSYLLSIVFKKEQVWQTLPLLGVLPRSMVGIAYAKVLGCLLSTLPVVTIALVSIELSYPLAFDQILDALSYAPEFALMGFGFGLYYTHLLVYLSLRMTRGGPVSAVAITFGTIVLCTFLMGEVIGYQHEDDGATLIGLLLIAISITLHSLSLSRLCRQVGQ